MRSQCLTYPTCQSYQMTKKKQETTTNDNNNNED